MSMEEANRAVVGILGEGHPMVKRINSEDDSPYMGEVFAAVFVMQTMEIRQLQERLYALEDKVEQQHGEIEVLKGTPQWQV